MNDSQSKTKKVEKQSTQPKESEEQAPSESCRQGQGIQCRACHRFGHIAKFCKYKQKRNAEAPGKSKDSNSHVVTTVKQLSRSTTGLAYIGKVCQQLLHLTDIVICRWSARGMCCREL